MTAAIADIEPTKLRAGDTWKWTKSLADYAAGTYTLKYRFKNAGGGFEITADAAGSDYSITVSAGTSAAIAAGTYDWLSWVEAGTEKYSIATGKVVVLPDLRSGQANTPYDARTHARKVLDAVKAVIEGRATLDQERYMIAGRELIRTPIADLLKLRQTYEAEVAGEEAANRIANGTGWGRGRIQFRRT